MRRGSLNFFKILEKLNFILAEIFDSFSPTEIEDAVTDDSSIRDMTQVFANSSMEDSMGRSCQFTDGDEKMLKIDQHLQRD